MWRKKVAQRFMSPDPIVHDPNNSQCYNKYSYCINNPLRYTDPSGYNILDWIGGEAKHFGNYVKTENHKFDKYYKAHETDIIIGVDVAVMVGGFFLTAGVADIVAGALEGSIGADIAGSIGLSSSIFATSAGSATALTGLISGFAGGFAAGFAAGSINSLITGKNFENIMTSGLKEGVATGLSTGLTTGLTDGMGIGSKALNFFVASNFNANLNDFSTHRISLTLGPVSFSFNEGNNSFSAKSIFNRRHNNATDYLNYGLSSLYALEGFGEGSCGGLIANDLIGDARYDIGNTWFFNGPNDNVGYNYTFNPAIVPFIQRADQHYFNSTKDFF